MWKSPFRAVVVVRRRSLAALCTSGERSRVESPLGVEPRRRASETRVRMPAERGPLAGLPARNRTWLAGFVDRCSDPPSQGESVMRAAGSGTPPRSRTWCRSLRRRRPFPLGEWGGRAGARESREGIRPSRAVLQTALLIREPARLTSWNRRDSNSHLLGAGQGFSL